MDTLETLAARVRTVEIQAAAKADVLAAMLGAMHQMEMLDGNVVIDDLTRNMLQVVHGNSNSSTHSNREALGDSKQLHAARDKVEANAHLVFEQAYQASLDHLQARMGQFLKAQRGTGA